MSGPKPSMPLVIASAVLPSIAAYATGSSNMTSISLGIASCSLAWGFETYRVNRDTRIDDAVTGRVKDSVVPIIGPQAESYGSVVKRVLARQISLRNVSLGPVSPWQFEKLPEYQDIYDEFWKIPNKIRPEVRRLGVIGQNLVRRHNQLSEEIHNRTEPANELRFATLAVGHAVNVYRFRNEGRCLTSKFGGSVNEVLRVVEYMTDSHSGPWRQAARYGIDLVRIIDKEQ